MPTVRESNLFRPQHGHRRAVKAASARRRHYFLWASGADRLNLKANIELNVLFRERDDHGVTQIVVRRPERVARDRCFRFELRAKGILHRLSSPSR